MKQTETNKLRQDLTPEEKEKALKIGRIEFKSAGAKRKGKNRLEHKTERQVLGGLGFQQCIAAGVIGELRTAIRAAAGDRTADRIADPVDADRDNSRELGFKQGRRAETLAGRSAKHFATFKSHRPLA